MNRVALAASPLFILFFMFSAFFQSHDSSFIRHSEGQPRSERPSDQQRDQDAYRGKVPSQKFVGWEGGGSEPIPHRQRPTTQSLIKYRAKQVIIREGEHEEALLPMGTSFSGELISSIDTRQKNQWVKVVLPFGAKFKDRGSLPKNTILMGNTNYSGEGERVFIAFSKGILPSGDEFSLQAEVLDFQGQSQGLVGNYHSQRGGQIASILGLSMVSGVTDVLVKKKAVGEYGQVVPKATMKNAFYSGMSRVAEMESQRQTSKLDQLSPYVTVSSGSKLTISLTSSLKGDFLDE